MDSAELTRAWLEVDLGAIRRNAARLAAHAGTPIIAMLKADGYGLGAVAIARVLVPSAHVWGLGVATTEEGLALRRAGIEGRIFCCTPVAPAELPLMQGAGLTPSLSRAEDIAQWANGGAGPWHLSIDTGMNRAGARWDTLAALRDVVAQHPPEGVFTHFAAAEVDDSTRPLQEARFALALDACQVRDARPDVLLHVDSSLGLAARSPTPYDLARPGIALYGWPMASGLPIEPVFKLKARVVDMRTVQGRDTVSYGGTWAAPDERRIATLSIGYADGYRRSLSNVASVWLGGTRCAVVGIVTMDMTMVDVTDTGCALGDTATLIGGGDAPSLEEVAAWGGLSPYELLVGLRLRACRVYEESAGG